MPKTNPFIEWLTLDLFHGLPGIRARAMFGGYGLYAEGKIFGIVVDKIIYLKVDGSNRPDYEKAGSKPFTYGRPDGTSHATMSYWSLPDEIVEHPEKARQWAEKSLRIPRKTPKKKS